MKKVALLKNDEICYGSLIYYLEQIGDALNSFGVETEVVECIDEAFVTQKWDGVIGINQETLSVQLEDGAFLFDFLQCPILALIVDSPYHHDRLLRAHPNNMHLICVDRGHVDYAQTYYGSFQSVEMGYVLGSIGEPIPYNERTIDVLFTGTRADIEGICSKVQAHPQKWVRELFEYLVAAGMSCPNIATEKQVLYYFSKLGMQISKEDYKLAMATAGTYAEFYLRGYYRERILSTLLDSSIPVTVVGDGWNGFAKRHPNNLTLYKSVDFSETAEFMTNAKIVLNVMPWFKDGLHERVPTSMHNGAVCVTDKSSYIEEYFTDGEELVLYDLARLDELPGKIAMLLERPQTAEKIAENGRKKAQNCYTWREMVKERILPYLL